MADQESTDISTLDEAQATEALNDTISFDDDETTESTTSDKNETVEESQEDEDEADTEQQDDSTEDEESEETEESESTETELSDEDKQKQHNKEMAEKRIQAKQEREQSLKEFQDSYLEEADPDNPQDVVTRQLQAEVYNQRVERNTDKLTTQYEKALKDFDILNDKNPVVQKQLDKALDTFQAIHVKIDRFGNPSDVNADLYQYLQSEAESIKELTRIGASEQVRSKGKEKSKSFTPPSRSPKQSKDPLMDVLLAD